MNHSKKIKRYLKSIQYQLLLIYSKEDVQAIMNIIYDHVDMLLSQNPAASEEDIKQSICDTGDFVKAGLEDIDIPVLIQKVEQATKLKKKKKWIGMAGITLIVVFVLYCIHSIMYARSVMPAYITEEIIDYGDIPSTEETDSIDFSSESSSESTE